MADIIFSRDCQASGRRPTRLRDGEPIWDLIELLFFAYRDFVSDPDHVLEKFGFGRAHHRVLHFVNRNPGMKVADLLDILRITKQSLGRVLKQLVDEGYVVQKEGPDDRRHRLLFVTPKGEQLAMKLAGLQTERITRALAGLGPNAHEAARDFLAAMIDAESREGVLRFIARADRARGSAEAEREGSWRRLRSHFPTTRRTCSSSTTTGASAICCRAFCSPRAIASPRRTTPRMRAPSWRACRSTCSCST